MAKVTALDLDQQDACPIRNVLSRVQGKWQPLILLALDDGPMRFGALKRAIGDVTQRVLTQHLRGLERDGYLTRTVSPGPPLAVSYALTDQGKSYVAVLFPMVLWAKAHHAQIRTHRRDFDAGTAE